MSIWVAGSIMLAAPADAQKRRPTPADGSPGLASPSPNDDRDATIIAPYLFGHTRTDAEALARASGFSPRFGKSDANGSVVGQSIPAGREASRGTVLVIRMGSGAASSRVPALIGLGRVAALERAQQSGLKPLFYGPDSGGAIVATQSLTADQQVAEGTYIQLQMRPGRQKIRVPDFRNLSPTAATSLALSRQLRPSFVGGKAAAGVRVAAQTPAAGEEVPPDTAVQLEVAAKQLLAPNLLKRTLASARTRAQRSGVTIDVAGENGPAALITQQTPAPGTPIDTAAHIQVVTVAPVVSRPEAAAASGSSTTGPGGEPVPVKTADGLPASGGSVSNPAAGELDRTREKPGPPHEYAPLSDETSGSDKPASEHNSWPGVLGGIAAIAAGGSSFILWQRRRARNGIGGSGNPLRMDGGSTFAAQPPLVTYTATVDAGRPTVRLMSEKRIAARALTSCGISGPSR